MKTIGIMTWYKSFNYGTVLQSYSLNRTLQSLGYKTTFINYTARPKFLKDKIIDFKTIKRKIEFKTCFKPIESHNRAALFSDFSISEFLETRKCENLADLFDVSKSIDLFVCGTDQTWNLNTSFDDYYYLPFVEKKKKICYGASFGRAKVLDKQLINSVKPLMRDFDYLSCREESGTRIIKDICGKNAQVVLDPTMLISLEEWQAFAKKSTLKSVPQKYLLCYFLGKSKRYLKYVKKIAKELNLSIINIPVYQKKGKFDFNEPIGPHEFVNLFCNSSYVCTDSFHGLVFSTIFKKGFTSFLRFRGNNNENIRVKDFLNRFDLNKRLDYAQCKKNIDYNSFEKKLILYLNDSLAYLKLSIKSLESKAGPSRIEHNYCIGCNACTIVCPKSSIEVKLDRNGFYKYSIDNNCIECGACHSVCPVINKSKNLVSIHSLSELMAYQSKNKPTLMFSSSGGAINDLCEKLMDDGYIVCGSHFDKKTQKARHIIISKKNDLKLIQGSKYIQSNTEVIKKLIKLNHKFVFIGTPCEVAGLDNVLTAMKKRQGNILIDLVCHGFASSNLLDIMLDDLSKKHKWIKGECSVIFRDKTKSWHKKYMTIFNAENSLTISERKNMR